MIYIHTYGVGKFGEIIKKSIHDSLESANAKHAVFGGSVVGYVCEDEIEQMRHVLCSEVSEIIDDFSTRSPGSAGSFAPGSPEWDCRKVKAMNMVNQIIDGDY